VLRLLSVPVNQAMRENWGRVHPKLKRQIMMGDGILNAAERRRFHQAFSGCGELSELVRAQCRLQRLYRMRSIKQAAHWFTRFTDELARSNVDALRTLRKTLMAWRTQVLAYFASRLTNARTEGFNLKAKLVKRRGFGYRSPVNYRLRVLNACSGSTRASPYLTPGRLQFIDKEALIRRSKLLDRRYTLDLSTLLNDPTQRE
jgi:transposase